METFVGHNIFGVCICTLPVWPLIFFVTFALGQRVQKFMALEWIVIYLDESCQVPAKRSGVFGFSSESSGIKVEGEITLSAQGITDRDTPTGKELPTILVLLLFWPGTVFPLLVPLNGFPHRKNGPLCCTHVGSPCATCVTMLAHRLLPHSEISGENPYFR